MREAEVESYLVRRVRELGGIAYKFVSPGRRGVPDRMILWPIGVIEFVELKAPGKKPTPRQLHEHKRLQKLGMSVSVLDSKEAVDEWLSGFDKGEETVSEFPKDHANGN